MKRAGQTPLLAPPKRGECLTWLVLTEDAHGDPLREWYETRDEAVRVAEDLKRDAMDSGDPITVYVLRLELQS